MGGFIVERYWPGVTEADVRAASAALQRAALQRAGARRAGPNRVTAAGPPADAVRYLGGILLPGDEVVLFRFEAPDAGLVEALGVGAGVRCDRVLPAMFLD